MKYFLKLNALGIHVNLTYLAQLRNLNLLIIFIINFVLLFSANDGYSSEVNDRFTNAINVLGILQLVTSLMVFVSWAIFKMPLDFKNIFI